jgi:hypothetical protein
MDVTLFAASAGITFVYVFLKAMQQLNVVHGRKFWIMPTSVLMGLCEVGIVLVVVRADTILLGLANGVAGGLAALTAMYLHTRITK